ncbi:MAG TPA: hypothetical protein DEV93_11475 [Chloroflexi bacterium]|nr:hypothetical protein [Chloroflexota bacterium]
MLGQDARLAQRSWGRSPNCEALVAWLFDCDVYSVQFFECNNALAIKGDDSKATSPRRVRRL